MDLRKATLLLALIVAPLPAAEALAPAALVSISAADYSARGAPQLCRGAATILKVATPYFGETTSGLQGFDDVRATVKLGELEVLESDAKPSSGNK